MLPQWFVIYVYEQGEGYDNSLDRGVEAFLSRHGAESFMKVWRNKGYTCHLFEGQYIYTPQVEFPQSLTA